MNTSMERSIEVAAHLLSHGGACEELPLDACDHCPALVVEGECLGYYQERIRVAKEYLTTADPRLVMEALL